MNFFGHFRSEEKGDLEVLQNEGGYGLVEAKALQSHIPTPIQKSRWADFVSSTGYH